jgi:hypothetical protein
MKPNENSEKNNDILKKSMFLIDGFLDSEEKVNLNRVEKDQLNLDKKIRRERVVLGKVQLNMALSKDYFEVTDFLVYQSTTVFVDSKLERPKNREIKEIFNDQRVVFCTNKKDFVDGGFKKFLDELIDVNDRGFNNYGQYGNKTIYKAFDGGFVEDLETKFVTGEKFEWNSKTMPVVDGKIPILAFLL